ncbi:MAG: ATP-binding protein [Opitutaceae bacterium]
MDTPLTLPPRVPPLPRNRAAAIIDRSPMAMLEVEGSNHVVCFVNAAFCRLVGKRRNELQGKPFAEVVPHGIGCLPQLDRIYQTGKSESHAEPDGSQADPIWWNFAMWPTLDARDRPVRLLVQLTLVSPHQQNVVAMNEALLVAGLHQHELRAEAEKANTRFQEELARGKLKEVDLRRANEDLKIARCAAEQANRAKDDFLAALSHELRTPLTPVLLVATALREDVRLPPDVRAQLGMVERNIAVEARLIDDLLDVTRIAHGKLNLYPELCDAHSLIGLAIEIVAESARFKHIAIECEFNAHQSGVVVDSARFQQVIWNLLRNSVKFTPPDGKIKIRTSNAPGADGKSGLTIEVVDTGVGLAAHDLEKIFQPFDQGSLASDHRSGGVGLGLAIARAVVDLHGGRISAQSPGPNCGATFRVELPGAVERPPGIIERLAPPAVRPILPLRLLLVDDHPSTLNVLSRLLERDGHHVTVAATLAEALKQANLQPFDLVISDLGLPDGTGTELMEQLRADHGLRGIALSGYGMEADIARSREAGFAAHLVKPILMNELRRVIASLTPPPDPGKNSVS